MSYRGIVASALGLAATLVVGEQVVFAQHVSNNGYRRPLPRRAVSVKGRPTAAAYAEELPAMQAPSRLVPSQPKPSQARPPQAMPAQAMPPASAHSDPFSDDSGPMHEYAPSGECCDNYCGDDYCGDVTCDTGCCDTCGPGCSCSSGQCFVTADYLYLRSSFSDSVEFVDVGGDPPLTTQQTTQFEFDYESSFRVGGGYRLCGCGDEIRFLYTRMESSAFDQQEAGTGIFVPYNVRAAAGSEYRFHADVEINSFDLDFSKTIPLGGSSCGCGSGCGSGCGDGCGGCSSSCPAWDVRWSGGFRAAEAEWQRTYAALVEDTTQQTAFENAVSSMDFEGAGLKVGLEGRRYFFQGGWLSMYAKGDLSLLYGRLEFNTIVTEEAGAVDPVTVVSTTSNQIVPVTELEAGLSGQISCNGRISAGYLLSAWHDLGFRDEPALSPTGGLEIQYDDANILGFDGFFARVEYGF